MSGFGAPVSTDKDGTIRHLLDDSNVQSTQKWYRNLAVTEAVVETLRPLKKGWLEALEAVGTKAKPELAAYRSIL